MNQNSSVQSKTILLAVLFLVFGFFLGKGLANQSASNLGASATKAPIVKNVASLTDTSNEVNATDISVIDDGSGNKVATKNKILLSGGLDISTYKYFGDIYESMNGKVWSLFSQNNPWAGGGGGLAGHNMLNYKGVLYILGGSMGYNNAFWKYSNGSWIQKGVVPSKGSDNGFGSVVYNGKIYVMGGADHNGNVTNQIWTYDNVNNWVKKTNAPWPARRYFKTIVYQNKIWVIGGNGQNFSSLNDVWAYDITTAMWSQYGTVPWTNVTQGDSQTIAVFDDGTGSKIYMTGGTNNLGVGNNNDVWTFDGITWNQKPNATWSPRSNAGSYVMNGKLYIAGGLHISASSSYNDIWSTTDGNTWQLEKLHASWLPRGSFAVVKVPVTFGQTVCDSTSQPNLTIKSPNGGETYMVGDTITVSWTGCDPTKQSPYELASLELVNSTGGKMMIAGGPGVPTLLNDSYTFTIPPYDPDIGTIGGSDYKINIHIGNLVASYNGFDESDNLFTINP